MDAIVLREKEKNRQDKEVISAVAEKNKMDFISEIRNGAGNEMVRMSRLRNNPIKLKKPLRIRISEKLSKLKNKFLTVFGLTDDTGRFDDYGKRY